MPLINPHNTVITGKVYHLASSSLQTKSLHEDSRSFQRQCFHQPGDTYYKEAAQLHCSPRPMKRLPKAHSFELRLFLSRWDLPALFALIHTHKRTISHLVKTALGPLRHRKNSFGIRTACIVFFFFLLKFRCIVLSSDIYQTST